VMFQRLRQWLGGEDVRSPHLWSLWEVVDRQATGKHGQRRAGVKSMQVRRCVRCGLTEERELKPGIWERFPDCEQDEHVDRFSGQ
jgi:hypothetical protein